MNTPINFELAQLLVNKNYPFEFITVGEIKEVPLNIPTVAEVVMWIYEKHGVWIETPFWDFKFRIKIINTIEGKILRGVDFEGYNSPTEAYEAVIEYVSKNLI